MRFKQPRASCMGSALGHGDEDSHQWGLLTGWRMIAQDVMKELETGRGDDECEIGIPESLLPRASSEFTLISCTAVLV